MLAGESAFEPLLQVRGLSVEYPDDGAGAVVVLDEVTFELGSGETLGVVGESGSGKTTLALSLLGLLPAAARVTGGSVTLRGRELLGLSEREMLSVRGAEVALVSQEPGVALHPQLRAGDQVAEVLRAHRDWSRARCREEALALLAQVGLEGPARRAYPHELSGGQQQRVTIAQAIACGPALLVADEPTSALDPTTRAEILALLRELRRRLSLAVLLVSHDLGTVAALADRMLVMRAGRVVEQGATGAVCREPQHAYTRALLAALPRGFRHG